MPKKNRNVYERKATPIERLIRHSPFSIVTMIARIKGDVSESKLRSAVSKIRRRHTNLRVRIKEDPDHVPWFTSEGVGEIPIDVVPRESDEEWIKVLREASKVPFEFATRPAIRFILVQSPGVSELIILCHHVICDGLSLAYLARDLMAHLGDPAREVEVLPDPVLMDGGTLPADVALNGIVKFFIRRINTQWEKDRIDFDQEDYRNIHEAYWAKYEHRLFLVELSESQTSALVARCRTEGVTVNSALTMAFVEAQSLVQGKRPYHSNINIAASVRDRLRKPVGEAMGFYAGIVNMKYAYDGKLGFWENTRKFHRKFQTVFVNKTLFKDFVTWCWMEAAILEAILFKKLGGLVAPQQSRYRKLSAFGRREDVVFSILKREKQDSLDRIFMGTAVSNLTRLDFPRRFGALELERLILQPGGGFPLANVNVVLGAVTCSGKLSLVVEYAEQAIDTGSVHKIKDAAMELLLKG